jgi:hypothetical protein
MLILTLLAKTSFTGSYFASSEFKTCFTPVWELTSFKLKKLA